MNKENQTSLPSNFKIFQLQKQVQKANETIKRLQTEMKNYKKAIATESLDTKLRSQDLAKILTKAEQQKNNLIKQYSVTIEGLKNQIEGDNKVWIERFDVRKKQYEIETMNQKKQCQRVIKQMKQKLLKEIDELKLKLQYELQEKIDQCEENKMKIKIEYEKNLKQMMDSWKEQKDIIIQKKEALIFNLQQKQVQQINKINKSYESIVTAVKSQKKSEEHLHQETKNKMQTQKKALQQMISSINNQLISSKQQIQQLKTQNNNLKIDLQQQIEQNKKYNVQWQQRLAAMTRSHECSLQQLTIKHQQNAASILQIHFQHIQQLQLTLTVLQTKNQEQKELHNSQIEQIKQIYQQRPSRQQDLVNMNHIQQKLLKKMREIQILKNELKWCRLELDNKQEVYNKIFACQKPLMPPIHRDRKIRLATSINHKDARSNKMSNRIA